MSQNPRSYLLEVVEHLGLIPPIVCKKVAGLVHKGLVYCEASTTDLRKVTLMLTAQGQAIKKNLNGTPAPLDGINNKRRPSRRRLF